MDAEKPKSEKICVSPKMNVKIATMPNSSFVKNLERTDSLKICVKPLIRVDNDVQPRPYNMFCF